MCPYHWLCHQHVAHEAPTALSKVSPGTFHIGRGTVQPRCSEKTCQELPAHIRLAMHLCLFAPTQRLIGSSLSPQRDPFWTA